MNKNEWKNYRKEFVAQKINKMELYYLDIMVTGGTGVGKSTTLNTLFERCVASVGRGTEPETQELMSYEFNNMIRFWDTPGLGDGVAQDVRHSEQIIELLRKSYDVNKKSYGWIDLVIVILDGGGRDLGSACKLLHDVIMPNFPSNRILVGINQADMVLKGRHWKGIGPDMYLEKALHENALKIKKRLQKEIKISIETPICYSAEYGYNIDKFLDFIIDSIPSKRRPL